MLTRTICKEYPHENEFLLTSGNFNTSNSMSVFVFGKYTDFSRIYHNAPSHIICSLSQSPAVITINVNGLRIEAITDPKDKSDQLDMIVSHSRSTKTTTFKEKLEQNVCITDTRLVVENDLDVIVSLTLDYIVGKEIAIFISGRRGEGYVDPLIQENLPYGEMLKIPRYKSFETGDRRGQILVTGRFKDVAGYLKENLVSYLYNSESRNLVWKFNRVYSGTGEFYFQFSFPCLICLDGLTLRQKLNESLGTWMFRFFNEETGIWEDLRNIAFVWNARVVVNVTADYNKAARMFRLVHMTGNTHTGTSIKSITFVTKEITYIKYLCKSSKSLRIHKNSTIAEEIDEKMNDSLKDLKKTSVLLFNMFNNDIPNSFIFFFCFFV